jgi:hypothetical protein
MLIPDGVYLSETEPAYFRAVTGPTSAELQGLLQRISERIGRHLERKGLLVRDLDSSHLALEPGDTEDALADLRGHSIIPRCRRNSPLVLSLQQGVYDYYPPANPATGDILQGSLAHDCGLPAVVKGHSGRITGGRRRLSLHVGDITHRGSTLGLCV